ncbi:MAG: glycosyltransferase, partial [bacterium]
MSTTKYALVTPARNEEAYIEKTLQSVTTQTVLPQKWVIVSDGSTDGTDSIVQEYAQKHTFIRLIRKSCDQKRTFSSKINAFETGCEHLQSIDHDFIGMLDADVSFGPDYYEKVLDRFAQNEKLGVVGGIRYDLVNGKFVHVLCAENSVGGPYQLFRRACFEQIGGFPAIAIGGEDAVAEIKARML